jgi:hypothetical protein
MQQKIFIREMVFKCRELRPAELMLNPAAFYNICHPEMVVAVGVIEGGRNKIEINDVEYKR